LHLHHTDMTLSNWSQFLVHRPKDIHCWNSC